MNKAQFKTRWESDNSGGGITYDEIADCAKAWGIASTPRTQQIDRVTFKVLKAANVIDAEEYNPDVRAEQ